MTNLKIAQNYDFESVGDFYFYIIESYENGNFHQCKDLMTELNDLEDFIEWLLLTEYSKRYSILAMYISYNH